MKKQTFRLVGPVTDRKEWDELVAAGAVFKPLTEFSMVAIITTEEPEKDETPKTNR